MPADGRPERNKQMYATQAAAIGATFLDPMSLFKAALFNPPDAPPAPYPSRARFISRLRPRQSRPTTTEFRRWRSN